jgi:hypothetical protein
MKSMIASQAWLASSNQWYFYEINNCVTGEARQQQSRVSAQSRRHGGSIFIKKQAVHATCEMIGHAKVIASSLV